jgi:hypothetical protein
MDLLNQLKEVITTNADKHLSENNLYTPAFYKVTKLKEAESLLKLLSQKPNIKIYDNIASQLKELVKSRKPNLTLNDVEIAKEIELTLNGTNLEEFGTWVYYPWNEKIVHILDEDDFIELRTSRNKYKITEEERKTLALKKIGVIGLSVGQSVSLTLAMERCFGELRIADFDELELTNLNRLRSGVHNLGLKKTVIVAREIAEIDPYLKVTCFHEGITENNLEPFLLENGKLDVLIDECDGVDIKLKCRVAAKKNMIPVLMEASDRGTVDVERFDLEPERPLLHGYIQHLDVSKFHTLTTNEQKLPYLLAFAGVETLSTRMKASAVEVGQTISTWPQLASAVTMGGGITADICRRVLLDQFHQSGRYFIDIEELVGDPKQENQIFQYNVEKLTIDRMREYASKIPNLEIENAIHDKEIIESLVKAALVAPSPGNNQPWKWYFDGTQLYLFNDEERAVSYGDFNYMATYMSLGGALENIQLKASELQLKTAIKYFPLKETENLVSIAALQFFPDNTIVKDDLVNYLNIRYTNRRKGDGNLLDEAVLNDFKNSLSGIEDVQLTFITENSLLQRIAAITGKAEKLRMFIPQGHYELFEKEIRWTKESAENTRDGLDIRTLDLEVKDAIGFRVSKDAHAIKLVNNWNKGSALENMTKKLVSSASAVGLISIPNLTPENCLSAGNAAQRLWLTASKHQIAMQPALAAVLHFARLIQGNGIDMPENIQVQFKKLHDEFNLIFDKDADRIPVFLFRLFNATEPSVKSLRLNLEEIYFS